MRCGNHVPVEAAQNQYCLICEMKTVFVIVTEENKDSLPFPTLMDKYLNAGEPGKTCQCRAGTCPCGKFVAHKIDDPCNANDFIDPENREKELAEQAAISAALNEEINKNI